MIIETDSDLQRLWAQDTNDLGALEVFHFHLIFIDPLFRYYFYVWITTCRNIDLSEYRPACQNIDLSE